MTLEKIYKDQNLSDLTVDYETVDRISLFHWINVQKRKTSNPLRIFYRFYTVLCPQRQENTRIDQENWYKTIRYILKIKCIKIYVSTFSGLDAMVTFLNLTVSAKLVPQILVLADFLNVPSSTRFYKVPFPKLWVWRNVKISISPECKLVGLFPEIWAPCRPKKGLIWKRSHYPIAMKFFSQKPNYHMEKVRKFQLNRSNSMGSRTKKRGIYAPPWRLGLSF